MRGLRSTIALVVVLAGLGAYIYFVTWKQPEESAPKLEKVFASVQADSVDDLVVTSSSGETTTLKKVGGNWQITAPLATRADDTNISNIMSNLGTIEVSRVIDENPTDLQQYGLANPRITIQFRGGGEKEYRKLILGDKSPTGTLLYAKRNDEKRVFLTSATPETVLDRSTFALRDKTVVKFDREKLTGIEIAADRRVLRLDKDGAAWKIVQPLQALADYGAVEGFAAKLQSAEMKSIVSPEATQAELRKYGLDRPAITITLKADSSRATLVVGAETADGMFYARDLASPAVVTVDTNLVDDLKKGADSYRRTELFEFRAYNASHVEIERDGQTVVFDLVKSTGENVPSKWRRTSPNPADVDREKTESLLNRLADLRAMSFLPSTANTGLDKPAMTVRAKFNDTMEESVTFGKNGNDVYAARPNDPGAAKVVTADFTELVKALDEVAK